MNNKIILSVIFVIIVNLLAAGNASAQTWTTTTVDSTGDVGKYTSIALDSSGKAYISYFDSTNTNLKYATNASGSWVTTTVDSAGNVGWYTSIALDSSGKAYISHNDLANGDLKYSTNASGDTTPPSVSMNSVTSPTNVTSQTITGTVESGATVRVATSTAASDGSATVSGTTWSYTITGLVEGANGEDHKP